MLTTSWCLYLIDMNHDEGRFPVSPCGGRGAEPACPERDVPSRTASLSAQTAPLSHDLVDASTVCPDTSLYLPALESAVPARACEARTGTGAGARRAPAPLGLTSLTSHPR